ncbi:protein takeout-like [Periplaneta americana]|uniref:protein takeout-like n=1 Tax=Periplaneta americana TaxID=6978 RepID=UPI0037E8A59F
MGPTTMAKAGLFLVLVFVLNHGPGCSGNSMLPDNFPRCKQNDPNFDACLETAVEKAMQILGDGIPSLQLLPVDPLKIEKATIEQGGNSPVNYKFLITDSELKGLGKVKSTAARANWKDREFDMDFYVPQTILTGNYELDGKFTLLPIKGKGKFNMILADFKTNSKLKADLVTKDGNKYWNVKSINLFITEPKNFTAHFDNLFNGNKLLGESTNKALNENWKEFWEELRPSMEDTFGKVFVHISNVIFSKVPEKNLF